MIAEIFPSQANGSIIAPPSKSMAHRLLISAALAPGKSLIHNVSLTDTTLSNDLKATLDCLVALGAKWRQEDSDIAITGMTLSRTPDHIILPCQESGSTLRFLIPLALLTQKNITFTGSKRLFARALSVYEKYFAETPEFLWQKNSQQLRLRGKLQAGTYKIPGNISSQFVSGFLFALPLLSENSELIVQAPIESFSYITLTLDALKQFGIVCEIIAQGKERDFLIRIPGNQAYKAGKKTVEGDFSNAAFLDALNLFGGAVQVAGLNPESLQGDRIYQEIFAKLGSGQTANGELPEISLADCPDLGPIAYAAAAAKQGAIFHDTKRLADKESDRNQAMAEELQKFGITVELKPDTVRIPPGQLRKPRKALHSHNDHRIAMALAILATKTGAIIEQAEAVNKSYPHFFSDLQKLGIRLKLSKT